MTLSENIRRAIADFTAIKQTIINQGVYVPDGTPTSEYSDLIEQISVEGDNENVDFKVGSKLTPQKVESNWAISEGGVAVGDSLRAIVHYAVLPYSIIYVKAQDDSNACKFLWLNRNTVSVTDTRYNIGDPVLQIQDGFVVVPEGASYIGFSQLKTDTETGVYKIEI